jgi:peptide/nickel transport system substrate-binding protein
MAMFAWTMSPVSDGFTIWAEKFIPSEKNNFEGQNSYNWRNKEVSDTLDRVQRTLPEAERAAMLRRVQDVWAEELPAIPLFFRAEISAVPSRMKNWKPTGSLVPETWNIHEWQLAGVGESLAQ